MIRVHQFNKVEQFSLTRPDASWDELELLLSNTEALVGELGLPYRVVVLPAGDMSSASAKTYDVEIWFPSQGRYRETGSISNTTDFQSRRLGIRMRGEGGPEPVHMLNGTAVVDRMALAVLENFQGDVPDVLQPYGAPARIERLASLDRGAPKGASQFGGRKSPVRVGHPGRPLIESGTCGMRGKCVFPGTGRS